jgi:pimeloyl-ACP methyl ester carboxylesterase
LAFSKDWIALPLLRKSYERYQQHNQEWECAMKTHKVTGGGGVQLHVVEAGNPSGRPIVFIHGFSQCWLVWSRQMSSDLANDYRLVAIDMRGHGLSDKPREGYADSRLWADDVNAVIHALSLDHPVLCGWSYGPLVILDYIRHYAEDGISGIHFVGGITKLGSDEAMSVLAPEFLKLVPDFFATDAEQSVRGLKSLLRMIFTQEPSAEDVYLMLGYNLFVPPYVRQALFSRSFDNDDLLPRIRKPVLITHGAEDAIVKPAVVDQHKAGMAHAQIHMMANAGHAAFWDDAATFNQRLMAFCESL